MALPSFRSVHYNPSMSNIITEGEDATCFWVPLLKLLPLKTKGSYDTVDPTQQEPPYITSGVSLSPVAPDKGTQKESGEGSMKLSGSWT